MGVATDAQLCSNALLRVGERQLIDSLDGPSQAAQVCKAVYAAQRDMLLEAFPWPFAEREQTLALLATETKAEWLYVYVAPDDMARAEYIFSGIRNPPPELRVPFKKCLGVATNGGATVPCIATDMASAVLVYTSKVTIPTLFPQLFVEALTWKIAVELALGLAVKPALVPGFLEQYKRTMLQAAAEQLNQAQGDQPTDSGIIRARDGASTVFPTDC